MHVVRNLELVIKKLIAIVILVRVVIVQVVNMELQAQLPRFAVAEQHQEVVIHV